MKRTLIVLLSSLAIASVAAGCDEPNERNSIGPEDFPEASHLDEALRMDDLGADERGDRRAQPPPGESSAERPGETPSGAIEQPLYVAPPVDPATGQPAETP